jgi:hypothetical protein
MEEAHNRIGPCVREERFAPFREAQSLHCHLHMKFATTCRFDWPQAGPVHSPAMLLRIARRAPPLPRQRFHDPQRPEKPAGLGERWIGRSRALEPKSLLECRAPGSCQKERGSLLAGLDQRACGRESLRTAQMHMYLSAQKSDDVYMRGDRSAVCDGIYQN